MVHVVEFTTTYAIVVSLNPVHGEMYSIQHYVIKFVSDLRQVSRYSGNQLLITGLSIRDGTMYFYPPKMVFGTS